jgi:hypothetical protein
MPAKPKTKAADSLAALSRSTGITRQTLRDWQAAGIDIHNPAALAERIKAMRGKAPTGSLSEAKLNKVLLECERLQFTLDRERGLYYTAAEVHAVLNALDGAVCNVWKGLGRDLSNVLEGVGQQGLTKAINTYVDEILVAKFKAQLEQGIQKLKP